MLTQESLNETQASYAPALNVLALQAVEPPWVVERRLVWGARRLRPGWLRAGWQPQMNWPLHNIPPLGPPKATPRERVLREWRGIDLSSLEKARERLARPMGPLMERVLKDLRMDRRQGEAEIARVWQHLMSPDVVAHAQPTGLRRGTLFVTVDSSAWLDEIVRYRRKEILDRLQHSFGRTLITRISYRLG